MSAQNNWGRDVLGYKPIDQFIRMKDEKAQHSGKFVQQAKKWLLAASRNGSITVTEWRCFCGGNHFALKVGDDAVCPIRFMLAMTVLSDSEAKAKSFLERHNPKEILRPCDPNRDANYRPELHKEAT